MVLAISTAVSFGFHQVERLGLMNHGEYGSNDAVPIIFPSFGKMEENGNDYDNCFELS